MTQNTDPITHDWPDPLNVGWTLAWKQMADQLAEVLKGLLDYFGNEDQRAQLFGSVLEAYEDFTFYDDCHGGKQHDELARRIFDEVSAVLGPLHSAHLDRILDVEDVLDAVHIATDYDTQNDDGSSDG